MSTTPAARPRFDVFLSHSSADKPAVEAIGARLRGDGFRPFLDKWNLVPGMPWQQELSDALAQSGCVAVFFGSAGPSPWHSEEMQVALNRAVRTHDDYRVIPVLLPGSDASQVGGFLENRTWVDFRPGVDDAEAYGRLVAGIQGTAPETASYELPDEPRPYRGLERFESGHHEFFYGRDEDIARLVDRLRRDHFVAVVGASGSGKSSLVRAGLSTEAAERALPGIRDWRRIFVIPGHDPLRAVVDQVRHAWEAAHPGDAADPVQWVDHQIERFRGREDGLLTLLGTLFGAEVAPVLLVIDQFEEVFTHRPVARERDASWREQTACFAANLGAAVNAQPAWLRIVATLRADFITRFVGEDFPAFRQLLERRQLWLGPMSEEDLREAIVYPARRRGAFFEKGLVEMILRDMRGHPAALPLLEESLGALWEKRRGPWLTLDAYASTGGVGGALAAKADAIYAPLSPDEQGLTRRIFLGLIHLGEGVPDTRRRVPVPDLLGAADRPEQVEALLRRFSSTGGARLITLSSSEGVVTAELTHEALIHHWFQLRRWLDDSRGDLRLQRRLDSAAHHWQELGRPEGSLWRPPDLDLLEAFVARAPDAVTQLQLEFHESSRRAEEERRRERDEQAREEIEAARQLAATERQRTDEARAKVVFRRWAVAAGILAVLAIGATVVAGYAWNGAERARRTAEEAKTVAVTVAKQAEDARQFADRQARDLLTDQILRYERIPIALSGLTTPILSDGYPFTDQGWAQKEHDTLVAELAAMRPAGTDEVLRNWENVRKLLAEWDPRVAERRRPAPALQEAARDLARSFYRMWSEDTDEGKEGSRFASLRTIQGSRPFLEKRREAYARDVRVLNDLVKAQSLTESSAVRESYRDFWKLYWGELLIVEDRATAGKMASLGRELALNSDAWLRTGRKPPDFDSTAKDLIKHLEDSLSGSR